MRPVAQPGKSTKRKWSFERVNYFKKLTVIGPIQNIYCKASSMHNTHRYVIHMDTFDLNSRVK